MDFIDRLSPGLTPVWVAAHRRLSSGHPVTRIRVGPLDRDQRTVLADFLGTARLPGPYTVVSCAELDAVLGRYGATTTEVVTHLIGPLDDRAARKREAAANRDTLWQWLAAHPVVAAQPALDGWAATVRRAGLTGGSLARTGDELTATLAVLAALPAAGTPLPVFAEAVLRDPHALDDDRRVAGLVAKALCAIHDVPPPADAVARRALWQRVGVSDDELSSTVLAAGLAALRGDGIAVTVARASAAAGVAAALTLQQVRRSRITTAPADVWVVENPSVLALALTRDAACPPLVCTAGWPSSAATLLLTQLGAAGSRLNYHGDFDGEGLRIAAAVVARHAAHPWRMTSADYLAAVAAEGPPVGRVTAVPWDDELANHLISQRVAVPEERLAASLLDEATMHRTL